MLYLTFALYTLAGLVAGMFISYIITKRYLIRLFKNDATTTGIEWNSQQLLFMYLISNEMYRLRFNKWAKTQQALDFVSATESSLQGRVYILPVEDKNKVDEIIKFIKTGE